MNTDEIPETKIQAIRFFADGDKCHEFMVAMRWPSGVRCAHCDSENIGKLVTSTQRKPGKTLKSGKVVAPYSVTRRVWNCKNCKKQFTAKVKTIFEDSPIGLDKWLPALWMIVNAKNGVSSCEMARDLGVTQRTAWFMGHRIREVMHNGIFHLCGDVEVDETWIGGKARNMHAAVKREKIHGTGNKALTPVQGLLQRTTAKGASKVQLRVVSGTKRPELQGNVRKYVLAGATVHTDALKSYSGLAEDFTHNVVDHAVEYVRENVHTNGLENYWSLLKRTIKGTYIRPEPFHLFRYLDEQSFRFNERADANGDQGRFLTAMKSVAGRRLTYKKLTDKKN